MSIHIEPSPDHEHAFFSHDDPRYLICLCGQYAVRTRTDHGQASLRLIDPPTPVLMLRQRDCPDVDLNSRIVAAEAHRV